MGHTPGPWIRDDDEIGVETIIGGDRVFLPVCVLQEPSLYHTQDAILQQQDNAHLIIAAPDLLAALEQASREYMMLYAEAMADTPDRLRIVDMVKPATDAMTAAIAQAKGGA